MTKSDADIMKLLSELNPRSLARCKICDRDCCRHSPATFADMRRIMPEAKKLWKEGKLEVEKLEDEPKASDLFYLAKDGGSIKLSTKVQRMERDECGFQKYFKQEIGSFFRCVFLKKDGYCAIYPKTPIFCRMFGFHKPFGFGIRVGGCIHLHEDAAKKDAEEYLREGNTERILNQLFNVYGRESQETATFIHKCVRDKEFLMQSIGKEKIETRDIYETDILDHIFKRFLDSGTS